ncbi:hypothetical protein DL98DRAFT_596759 [Cadophora sp. DSE1049]|nr:hypothetical protein DL98DRAFT_596759 [Cadophora sp. DSE1049]
MPSFFDNVHNSITTCETAGPTVHQLERMQLVESNTPREESSVRRDRRSRHNSRRGSHSTYVDTSGKAYRVREPSRVYHKPE